MWRFIVEWNYNRKGDVLGIFHFRLLLRYFSTLPGKTEAYVCISQFLPGVIQAEGTLIKIQRPNTSIMASTIDNFIGIMTSPKKYSITYIEVRFKIPKKKEKTIPPFRHLRKSHQAPLIILSES